MVLNVTVRIQRIRENALRASPRIYWGRATEIRTRSFARKKILDFAKSLRENGVYTPAVRPPSVPEGMCRIRATLMAKHTDKQIEKALKAFKKSYKNLLTDK